MTIDQTIKTISQGQNLCADEARELFDVIFDGSASPEQIAQILLGLRAKGETTAEIQGAVESMRGHMKTISAPPDAMDIVGTGGDGHGTLNISTAASFVVAGAGVPVAKHGNRAASSLSGSSDVLSELGVNLEPAWDILEKALSEIGIVFLFAPRHHPAMRHVAPVRRELGVRTIFNLLGPLTNPAQVKRHLIGVFDSLWARPMAQTLQSLGSESAWITHGADGLDEISITGPSSIVALNNGTISESTLSPEDAALPRATLADIQGGEAKMNAKAIRDLLTGHKNAYRDIVLMNAGAALVVAGKAATLRQGIALAAAAIDSGAAKDKLDKLVKLTNEGK